jgi:uncharacterized membrane protein YdfJ with MMPL/SSD domain
MEGLGGFAFAHRRAIMAATLWAVVGALFASSVFDVVKPFGFEDPASESARAEDAIEDATGERVLPEVELLVRPATRDELKPAVRDASRELEQIDGIARVEGPGSDPKLVARDGDSALVIAWLTASTDDISQVGEDVDRQFAGDPDVVAGGDAVTAFQLNDVTEEDLRRIELYAAPLLLLLSLIVFRGFVAALLPLAVGVLSVISTLLVLRLLATVMEIDLFAINIVTGLGLGLAIDYSLFVVTRYRQELEEHGATEVAIRRTMGSIGRMVVFSGLTVGAALAALSVFPQRFLYSIGIGGALVAVTSAFVSLVVLPAMLSMLGHRVNALSPTRRRSQPTTRRWYRLGRFVLRHRAAVAITVTAAMVVAGLPFLRVELTRANSAVLPPDSSARQVAEAVGSDFKIDPSSRVVVLVESGDPRSEGIRDGRRVLRSDPAIAGVSPPLEAGGGLVRIDGDLIVPEFSDQAVSAVNVARDLDWGGSALVGGPPAELEDQRDSLADHLPLAIAIIVASTVFALFVMTRSVLLPLVALLMNTLTVSVAFGVLVLIFQDGRLEGLLDYTSPMALDTSMPILLFAVVFGLSTDYGVFLLQSIREARTTTAGPEAIARGLARSGRPITAAALLFAVAMGAFAFSDLIFIKEVAVGTAVAVMVDAAIVRTLLFPAMIGLLGPRAWWAPRWLGGRG